MSNSAEIPKSQSNVADQIRHLMENNPESLGDIQYGEVVIKVRAGRCVHMHVNHAFKLDEMGADNGDDQTKQGDSDKRSSGR